jgi:hypothetical protein
MCMCMPSTGTRGEWMHHSGCWWMHHFSWWMGTTIQVEVCWEFDFCFLSPFCCAVVVRFGFGCSLTGLIDAISIYLIKLKDLSINYKGWMSIKRIRIRFRMRNITFGLTEYLFLNGRGIKKVNFICKRK